MPLYYIIVLALVQGITEFLPISSSAHLLFVHAAINNGTLKAAWDDDLIMDLAVHVGTLLSVLLYFHKDVFRMIGGLKDFATGNRQSEKSRLLLYVIVGSIPVIIVGAIVNILEPAILRNLHVITITTIVFGILLWWADKKFPVSRKVSDLTLRDAILIGLAQTIALIPGTSRSGITMTAGRMLGLNRTESAHYSLLLAMVVTSAAGTLGALRLVRADNVALTGDALIAVILSFIAGFIAIAGMMRFLKTTGFAPYAIYRVGMGIVLIWLIYTGVIN
ncbi:MAG: undecaprenyl-diphosphate phosphatase [Alphaproteobacteria bacterium]|nr:undecaprenyl-diphosphate phosphatase [Alphaproteobacteria bacterium]MCB9975242.1 undecaprenyl-diphosphate phosphatase [Rhodospirillales bacterium]